MLKWDLEEENSRIDDRVVEPQLTTLSSSNLEKASLPVKNKFCTPKSNSISELKKIDRMLPKTLGIRHSLNISEVSSVGTLISGSHV